MRYKLTCVTTRFITEGNGNNTPIRHFTAPDDATAIHHAEHPQFPLKVIDAASGDAVPTLPRQLIEDVNPPRIVKDWGN
jgi:hypothetical protein